MVNKATSYYVIWIVLPLFVANPNSNLPISMDQTH